MDMTWIDRFLFLCWAAFILYGLAAVLYDDVIAPVVEGIQSIAESIRNYRKRTTERTTVNRFVAANDIPGILTYSLLTSSTYAEDVLVRMGVPAVELLACVMTTGDAATGNAAGRILARIGPASVESLNGLVSSGNKNGRLAAISSLRQIGDLRMVPPLITALKDDSLEVRQAAAYTLGDSHDVRAVDPLIAALKDESADVRQTAISALRQIGDLRMVPPLLVAIKDDSDKVREAAADVLRNIRDARAIDPLIVALKDDSVEVRRVAASSLGKIGSERASKFLIDTVINDNDPKVCKCAAIAVYEIDPMSADVDVITTTTPRMFMGTINRPCAAPGECWGSCSACMGEDPLNVYEVTTTSTFCCHGTTFSVREWWVREVEDSYGIAKQSQGSRELSAP